MSKQIDHILAQGVVTGLLSPADEAPTHASRPWPLTVFAGFGAWFAAIPFAVMLFLITDGGRSSLLATLCAIVLVGATAVLRERPPLFVEQLALAGLVASTLVLYFNIAAHGNHGWPRHPCSLPLRQPPRWSRKPGCAYFWEQQWALPA